ncbi:MAG: dihydroorotate dehydrogenase, partial [SAR324 cluster bacterium]|nr:dihydroorotate dehydrogenase [SAR324 cluster bacterium]
MKLKLFISILIPLLVLLMPTSWIPIAGITVIEHRMLAIFFAALFFWILEP